jgi:hypothetical protein
MGMVVDAVAFGFGSALAARGGFVNHRLFEPS